MSSPVILLKYPLIFLSMLYSNNNVSNLYYLSLHIAQRPYAIV